MKASGHNAEPKAQNEIFRKWCLHQLKPKTEWLALILIILALTEIAIFAWIVMALMAG